MAGSSADAEAAAARINQEQLFHELEHKYVLLKGDFAVLERERDVAVEQKKETTVKLEQLQATVTTRDTEIVQVKDELLKVRTERDQLGFQSKTAQSQAERRLNEVEELQQTLKEQSKQLIEAQRREVEALQKAAEQESLVDPLRHNVTRVTKELESNKQHLEWMEKQLVDKTKLIQELRQSSSKVSLENEELQSRHADELASLRKQLESARQVSKKLESSLVQAKEHVKEVQASRMHEEERLHNELGAQRRLADLYKDAAEDANTRVNELQELCDTLRQSLSQSEDALAHQEERTKQHVESIFREQAAASERRIEALQDELKESQQRLQELQKNKLYSLQTASTVSEMSSAAGAAHLAAHGLSTKELCDQILSLETELRNERDEKEQIKICMDRVVKEVHEKAPMIMGLKLDLERSKESHAHVSERYEACMQELVKCRSRERQAVQDKHSFERKCDALAKSVDDMSRQVQHLLFRAHETNQGAHAAGEVASENLVVFKDVEELQVRNQQLLVVIRELTEAKKSHRGGNGANSTQLTLAAESDADTDSDSSASPVASGDKRLKTALKEIEELRIEREEERQMIGAIVKQRDMYRVLLAQADSKFVEVSEANAAAAPSSQGASPSRAQQQQQQHRSTPEAGDSKALREIQKEFETYKKEKQTNTKMLQDALDLARAESSSFRLSQMQAQVEAKCHKDRFEAAEKRHHDAEHEISRLRAKFDQANALLVEHQRLLSDCEAKLQAAVTQVRALEVEKNSALREVGFMKKNEDKNLHELATLRLDNTNLLKLMDTNRQLDSSREDRERRDHERLTQRLSTLENKLQEAYDKLESNDALSGAKIAAEEQAKKIATTELARTKEQLASAREQLARLEEQIVAASSKCTIQEKEVDHLREQLRKGTTAAAAERVAALEVQLRQSQREVQSAVEMKKSLTDAVSKYKAIAEANEKSLGELSNASEKWKREQEAKLKAVQAQRDLARTELEKVRAQIKTDVSQGNKLREEMDQLVKTHQAALQQSQDRQGQLQLEADSARAQLTALEQEVASLREDVSTAQDNYERELKLHASQIEKFSASRKMVQEEQTKNRALLSEIGELKARVAVAEKEALEKVSSLEKLMLDATQSKSSLVEQNKLLHTQLERANHQLRRAHETEMVKSIGDSSSSTGAAADREHDKELDDLRSVIAYLRKESEIVSSKYELAHQENQRLRTHVAMLETTVERLRDEIKRVEDASSSVSSSSAPPSDAAKQAAQLEQLDLLRESNATLREECQRYGARVKAEEERIKSLEAQLAPLRNSETMLKTHIESLKQEIIALTDANKRWKQRVEQLTENQQQIDPVEYEKVCAEKAAATKELAELQAKETALRAQLETVSKLSDEEKANNETLRKQYDRIKGFAKTWKAKADGLTKQLTDKTKEADDKTTILAELEKKLAVAISTKAALDSKIAVLEAAKSDGSGGAAAAAAAAAATAAAAMAKERQEMQGRIDTEVKRTAQTKETNLKLHALAKKHKQEIADLRSQLQTALQATAGSSAPTAPAPPVSTPDVVMAPPATVATTPSKPPAAAALVTPGPVPARSPLRAVPPAPVPAKSPLRTTVPTPTPAPTAPTPAPVPTLKTVPLASTVAAQAAPAPVSTTVPTLKTVPVPSTVVTTQVAKPVAAVPFGSAAVSASPAKPPAVKGPATIVAQAPKPAAAPVNPIATASPAKPAVVPAAPSTAATPVAATASTAEEDLRLVALRSMKKLAKNVPVKPSAAPTQTTVIPPTPVTTGAASAPALLPAKPPLPVTTVPPPKPQAEKPLSAVANPFLPLAPPTGAFGAFGSGGAGGLVFGAPGIKLPVPASPTPTPTATSAAATTFGSMAAASTTTDSTASADASPVVGGESEAQRRSHRLARFGVLPAADAPIMAPAPVPGVAPAPAGAPAAPATLKRPATSDPEMTAATPQKMAKLATANVIDSQETEDELAADASGTESQATESESATPPAPAT